MDAMFSSYYTFYAVLKCGSMSKAAKELYISQPAISMSISKLEQALGYQLLIRNSKGVMPSQQGAVLYKYLTQAFELIDQAQLEIDRILDLEIGEITIGASDTLSSAYLLPYLERFNKQYKDINIKVTNRTSNETIRLLKEGVVDIGFINLPFEDESIEVVECLAVHDILVGGTDFEYLSKTGVTIQELNQYPFLMLEGLSHTRKYIDQYANANQIQLYPRIELGSLDLLCEFARINLGLSFVIKEFAQASIDEKQLFEIPLTPRIKPRSIGLVYLKNFSMTNAVKRFIEMIELGNK